MSTPTPAASPALPREIALLGEARLRLGKAQVALLNGDLSDAQWQLFLLKSAADSLSLEIELGRRP